MFRLKFSGLAVLFLLLVLAFSQSNAGNLTLSPDNPKAGSTVNIAYQADGRLLPLSAYIYGYEGSSSFPKARQISLSYDRNKNKYLGSFKVPENEVFGLIKISNLYETQDDNRSKFWDYQIVDNDNNIVRSSYLQAGISYLGNSPANCSRRVNFKKALKMLKKENLLYPNNLQALIGAVSLRLDLGLITHDKFKQKIEQYSRRNFNENDENDVKSISRALRTLNKQDKAEKIEKQFAKKYPKSETAQEIYMSMLSQADNLDDFSKIVQDFLKAFPKSSNRERLFSALVSGYLQSSKSDEIEKILKSFKSVPSSALTQLAYAIVETDNENSNVNLDKATELMKRARKEAEKDKTHLKPVYMNEGEWKNKRNKDYIRVLEANAEVLLWAEKYEAALVILEKAEAACFTEVPGTIYALYIDLYSSTSNAEQALETATKAISNSQSSQSIEDYHKILFDSLSPGSDYDSFISNIKRTAREKRIEKLMHKQLNMSADLGVIKSVSGKTLDLDRQHGKVVVIEFWSTWCGPCREAMSAFDKLADKYALRGDIVFAAVAVWEKGENVSEAVNDFLTDAEFKVPAYLDEKSELPKNVGFTGLPARIYIGKNGKVQFIESGFTDEYSFKRDSEDIIELLAK